MQKRVHYRFYQKGVALLLTLLLVIVLMAMIIPTLLTPVDPNVKRQQRTQAALLMAKQALLGHIARHYEKGISSKSGLSIRLPCPDVSIISGYEGGAEGNCGSDNITVVGRFPWRSFDLEAVKDGYGECLWYAVSGNYKSQNDYKKSVVNEDTYGLIRMFSSDNLLVPQYGQTPQSRLVAAIISPGPPLSGEDRSVDTSKGVLACGGNYNPQNYLDAVAGFDNSYTPATVGAIFDLVNFTPQSKAGNDRIFPVTRDEIMQIIQQRKDLENKQKNLVKELAECVRQYGLVSANKGRLPWPAPVDIIGDDNYADQANYNDSPGTYLGRFPYNIDDTKSEIGSSSTDKLLENDFCVFKNNNEELLKFSNDWKDHLFYAVSKAREPANTPSGGCGNCVTVNGQVAKYSALVIFAGKRLSPPPVSVPQQIRTVPPPIGATGDSNTRSSISNYLEGRNASNYPDNDGDKDYQYNTSVNDILFCVPADLSQNVIECPYETP